MWKNTGRHILNIIMHSVLFHRFGKPVTMQAIALLLSAMKETYLLNTKIISKKKKEKHRSHKKIHTSI